jgi:hypothetical protein
LGIFYWVKAGSVEPVIIDGLYNKDYMIRIEDGFPLPKELLKYREDVKEKKFSLESGTIEVRYEPIQNTSHCDGNKDL